uniref:Uncharacterized protein n=1 Tax=Physcomitrium patens TaxID=3218 RepID=A0A2K1ISM5_PHYPA|nr:hypothetical protein PHYPA_026401 [Physcomitrium patens]
MELFSFIIINIHFVQNLELGLNLVQGNGLICTFKLNF